MTMIVEFDFPNLLEFPLMWIVAAFFGVILAFILIFKLKKFLRNMLNRPKLHGLDKREIKRKWREIEDLLEQESEVNFKLAVLEADKLLDHVLKFMGFGGSSLGERLKVACYKFEKLRGVWWAHKIRNQIVHEADYFLSYRTAKKALRAFEKSFEELGVL